MPPADTSDKDVGNLIAQLRQARGLSQNALGEMAMLVSQTVHRLEAGRMVRWRTMEAILTALGKEAKLPRQAVDAICAHYSIDPGRIDPRLVQEDADVGKVDSIDARDLQDLLSDALRAMASQPRVVRDAMVSGLRAQLQALAASSGPTTGPIAKHHPPQRVGDHEVTIIEPVSPPPSSQPKRTKSG